MVASHTDGRSLHCSHLKGRLADGGGDRGVVDTHYEVGEYEPEKARPLHHNRLSVW